MHGIYIKVVLFLRNLYEQLLRKLMWRPRWQWPLLFELLNGFQTLSILCLKFFNCWAVDDSCKTLKRWNCWPNNLQSAWGRTDEEHA